MYKIKLFFGDTGRPADEQFNRWMNDNYSKEIRIIEFKYEHRQYGDHSIAILYDEPEIHRNHRNDKFPKIGVKARNDGDPIPMDCSNATEEEFSNWLVMCDKKED